MSLLCRVGWHAWGTWVAMRPKMIYWKSDGTHQEVDGNTQQQRLCSRCGLQQKRPL